MPILEKTATIVGLVMGVPARPVLEGVKTIRELGKVADGEKGFWGTTVFYASTLVKAGGMMFLESVT